MSLIPASKVRMPLLPLSNCQDWARRAGHDFQKIVAQKILGQNRMFPNTNGNEIYALSYRCIANCRSDVAREHLDLLISLGQPLELVLHALDSFLFGATG